MQEEELHTTLVKAQQAIRNDTIRRIYDHLKPKVTIAELIEPFDMPQTSISRLTPPQQKRNVRK